MKFDKKILNDLELRNNSKNIDFFVNIIANRLLNNNDRNLNFLIDFRNFLKDQLLEKWRSKKDILKIFKRIFNRFAVPWIINKNWKLLSNTNLDAKASLFLLRKVWFKSNELFFQKDYLDTKDSCVNLTLWNIDWISIEWYKTNWLKSFLSNSSINISNSNRNISSVTNIIFNLLKELDLIDNVEHIERFVRFIDLKSNSFDIYNINWKETKPYLDSYRTLFGLSNRLPIDFILKYFESNKTWFEVFSDKELKQITYKNKNWKINLLKISKYRKDMINNSLIMMDKYIKNNIFLKYKNQNIDFILDNQSIPNALEVCSYYNKWLIRVYDTWDIVIFNPKWFYSKFSFLWVGKWKK